MMQLRTRWWRSRWMRSTSLSMDTSGIHLQTQKCMQTTSRERSGEPDQWKRIYRTTQNSVGWRNYGKNRSVIRIRTGPAFGWWGNWSRGPIPTLGQLSESEEKRLRLRVKQLICGSLNGMRIRQSLLQPYRPWTGTCIPRRCSGWELNLGIVERAITGWGLSARESTLTAVTQENIYYSYVLTCCVVDSFGFFFLLFSFFPLCPLLCCSCWFYWHYEI